MRQKSEYQERRITARKAALACSSLAELEELVVRLDKVEKSLIELVQKGASRRRRPVGHRGYSRHIR